MNDFTIYVTSLGSKGYFPSNTNTDFSNVLYKPLVGMQNFEVCLAACHISPPLPTATVLICSNIVVSSYYNEKQMPIVGIYSKYDTKHIYVPLATDLISVITCNLMDVAGRKVDIQTVPVVVLHFRKKQ